MANITFIPYPKNVWVDDLDDAYAKGYFSGSKSRWQLEEDIIKHNPSLRLIYGHNAIGIYDTINNKYVCGLGAVNPIPQFTIYRNSDNKVLARSWKSIYKSIRRQGYEIS